MSVIEVRVHGVGRHDPSEVLSAPIREAGNKVVGLYRPPDVSPHVRAFVWSRFTRRWTGFYRYLLFPFTLINVAGFMKAREEDPESGSSILRVILTLLMGASLTLSYSLWLVVLIVDIPLLLGAGRAWAAIGLMLVLTMVGLPLVLRTVRSFFRRSGSNERELQPGGDSFGPLAADGFWDRSASPWMFVGHVLITGFLFGVLVLGDTLRGGGTDMFGTLFLLQGFCFVVLSTLLLWITRRVSPSPYAGAVFVTGFAVLVTQLFFGALVVGIVQGGELLLGDMSPARPLLLLRSDPYWRWIPPVLALILAGWVVLQVLRIQKFITPDRISSQSRLVAQEYGQVQPWPSWVRSIAGRRQKMFTAGIPDCLLAGKWQLLTGGVVLVAVGSLTFNPRPSFGFSERVLAVFSEVFRPLQAPLLVVLYLLAAVTLVGLYWSLRSRGMQDKTALVFDVLGFWPRRHHPLAPPPYAPAVVSQLVRDLAVITSERPVILVGHSQGSVLAYAALVRSSDAVRDRVSLVTCGSPLASLYGTTFPSYFGQTEFERLAERLAPVPTNGVGWINFARDTDPIAGSIFGPGDQKDVSLRELNPELGLRVHSDYWVEPALRAVVNSSIGSASIARGE